MIDKIIRLFFLLSLSVLMCELVAQDEKEEETSEIVSFETKEFYTLQRSYRKEKKAVFAPLKEKLLVLLKQNLADAEKLYTVKKKSGNIKGMGIARKSKSIFSRAIESLNQNGDFKLPERVRKELRNTIKVCKQEQEKILAGADDKFAELNKQYLQKFEEQYNALFEEGKGPEKQVIAEKFKEFLSTDIPPPKETVNQRNNIAELKEMGMEVAKESDKPLKPIIASKGTGSKWVDIAKWNGDMLGMDVVNIPVLKISKDVAETQYFPIADADSKLFYKAINPMPEYNNYAFRLKRVKGMKGVEVIEWPSFRNDWVLVIRTKAGNVGELTPLKHAFIFQVSAPENEVRKLFGRKVAFSSDADGESDKKIEKKVPKVRIAIFSKPKSAIVYINNELYKVKGKTVKTPCRLRVPVGGCNIKLSMLGYHDRIYNDYKTTAKAVIKAVLKKDTSLKCFTKNVPANLKTWTSILSLKAGDKVTIKVEGVWCCTRSTKFKCGPKGIPNTTKTYKFYADASKDLRQTTSIPYGALLMKIGEEGVVRSLRRKTTFSVAKPVELFVDINEREGKPRKGNKGSLTLKIAVKSE